VTTKKRIYITVALFYSISSRR